MSVQLDIRVIVEAAMFLVLWACLKLAFVFRQMVLRLLCFLLKMLSVVQNIPRAVKEVFHNYSDVDEDLGNGKTSHGQMHVHSFGFLFHLLLQRPFGKCLDILDALNVYCIFFPKRTYWFLNNCVEIQINILVVCLLG